MMNIWTAADSGNRAKEKPCIKNNRWIKKQYEQKILAKNQKLKKIIYQNEMQNKTIRQVIKSQKAIIKEQVDIN